MMKIEGFDFIAAIGLSEPVEADHHFVHVDARIGTFHRDIADIEKTLTPFDSIQECLESGKGAGCREREVDRADRIGAACGKHCGTLPGTVVSCHIDIRDRETGSRRERVQIENESDIIDRIRQECRHGSKVCGINGVSGSGKLVLLRGELLCCDERLIIDSDGVLGSSNRTGPRRIDVDKENSDGDKERERGEDATAYVHSGGVVDAAAETVGGVVDGAPADAAFGEKATVFGSSEAEKPNETEPSLLMVIFEKIASLMRPSAAKDPEAAASALKLFATPSPSILGTPVLSTAK